MGKYLLFFCVLLFTGILHAQSCPEGYEVTGGQGAYGCAPRPDNDSYNQQQQPQQQVPQPPQEQWLDHWGAIATNVPHGVLGTSNNLTSKSEAATAALSDCRAKGGGSNCKLDRLYSNQCAALTLSDKGYNTAAAATAAKASEKGMKICTDSGDSHCHVYYTACSLPVRIQ